MAPQVLGALVRRLGHFDAAEDAVQEALVAAALKWPRDGIPERPRGWLFTVAFRRLTDNLRSGQSRHRREEQDFAAVPTDRRVSPPADVGHPQGDDTLELLILCCHPDLTPASQIALTLRAVGGLTTAEISHAFLVPESTMGQRISRAKQRIAASGARFASSTSDALDERLSAVRHVLYLIFNEGYTATAGTSLQRRDLATEAIRLTRMLHHVRPGDGETAGLLALMLLTDARHAARTDVHGGLVALVDQDRATWDTALITEGVALVEMALASGPVGTFQVQAAIAAVHAESPSYASTDWAQIVALYDVLAAIDDTPVVRLNQAIAVAMRDGPHAGLARLDTLADDPGLAATHRLLAARAHLLEQVGDREGAIAAYRRAATATLSAPEQRYLDAQAARLGAGG